MAANQNQPETQSCDVLVVGAGFAGLYALHKLRGLGLKVRVVEAGPEVGGTWYWNRYPGCRCDIESMQYSYSFSEELQQEWKWSERYAPQGEILDYLRHVAERFDLRKDIAFETRVTAARFDETRNRWSVETDRSAVYDARFCIMATGCLSITRTPEFEGLSDFRGKIYHTGDWPEENVDFSGLRVGVIGTGSSGVQSIPIIARSATELLVFQRTANFTIPARNSPMPPDYEADWKAHYPERRKKAKTTLSGVLYDYGRKSALEASEQEREEAYRQRWAQGGTDFLFAFKDIWTNDEANATAAEFVRGKIREIVKDPQTAERLTPHGFPIAAKRICVDTEYYETFNRDNVSLVDVGRAPIERFTETGIQTAGGAYDLDVIVFATGFDAMTGALLAMDIHGSGGQTLKEAWAGGPRSYLGLAIAGFPNLFTVTGPGSPAVLSNVVLSIEQHVEWIADCLEHMEKAGTERIEALGEAQAQWGEHVDAVGAESLYAKADSWYLGSNIPGKPRSFMPYMGGFAAYGRKCREVAEAGYSGFALGPSGRKRAG